MRNIISSLILIPILLTGISGLAQDIPPDPYRVATTKEISLHDTPYQVLQNQIKRNICDATWEISGNPFLLRNNPDEKTLIINYLKGVGNIPVFTRNGESFVISAKKESSLYKSFLDESKKETDAYVARTAKISTADKKELSIIKAKNEQYLRNADHSSNTIKYGRISLEFNQSWTDDKKSLAGTIHANAERLMTAPGV